MNYKRILEDIIPNSPIDEVKKIILNFNFNFIGNQYDYLYSAYINKRIDVVEFLIKEQDVSPFEKNNIEEEKIFVYELINNNDVELFKYLLLNSKTLINNIDKFDNNNDFNLLLFSCFNSKSEFVRLLIEYNANVNVLNRENIFPLYDACKVNNIEIVKLLIENGADIYKANIFNMTALGVSVIKDRKECFEYLLDKIDDFTKLKDYTIVLFASIIKDDFDSFKKILSNISNREIFIQETAVSKSLNIANEKLSNQVIKLTKYGKIPNKYIQTLINFEYDKQTFEVDDDEIFELKIKVRGVTYNNRQENIKKLHIGDELLLVLEPNNLYDKNAVLVTNNFNEEIGYIPRSDNKIIFDKLLSKQKYIATVYSMPSSNFYETIGVNIIIRFF